MTYLEMADLEAMCFPHSTTWSADSFAEHAQKTNSILVNFVDGFISGRVIFDEAEIITVAVQPASRHQGIASQMILEFEANARKLGAKSVFLEVSDGNAHARILYRRAGFIQVGTRPKYYRWPDGSTNEALILKKEL